MKAPDSGGFDAVKRKKIKSDQQQSKQLQQIADRAHSLLKHGRDHRFSEDGHQRSTFDGKHCGLAVVVISFVFLLVLHTRSDWVLSGQTPTAIPGSAGDYLRQIAELPQHTPAPPWRPPKGRVQSRLSVLDLDCTSRKNAVACAAASASNSYEGVPSVLLASDDMQLLLQALLPTAPAAYDTALYPLASLVLDCQLHRDACLDIAASSNAYESTAGSSNWDGRDQEVMPAAIAETVEYLNLNHADNQARTAWEAVIGSSTGPHLGESGQQGVLARTNQYEGVQAQAASWHHQRQAEEAGPHYLDVSSLSLDCSAAAGRQDSVMYRECRRSRSVNKYESTKLHRSAEHQRKMQHAMSDVAVKSVVSAVRVVPQHIQAALQTAAVVPLKQEPDATSRVEARRQYFKNPCNSPAAHSLYKNPQNNQQRRRYYKNPANAPATLEVLLPPPSRAPGMSVQPVDRITVRDSVHYAGLWVAAVTLLATCLCLDSLHVFGWLDALKRAVRGCQQWAGQLPRAGSGPAAGGHSVEGGQRCPQPASLMPYTSQELPAPQVMHVEVMQAAPLPVLTARTQCDAATPPLLEPLSQVLLPAERHSLGQGASAAPAAAAAESGPYDAFLTDVGHACHCHSEVHAAAGVHAACSDAMECWEMCAAVNGISHSPSDASGAHHAVMAAEVFGPVAEVGVLALQPMQVAQHDSSDAVEHLQADSPRHAGSRSSHRLRGVLMAHGSRAGTPGPCCKGD